MESNFKRIILPILAAVAIGTFAYVYSTSNNYTIITDQSVATDKIIVSDYAKVRDENLVKTCDVVVARDPSMAADIYCLDDDCSDEIQSAIDTVASKGGGVVCIRRGEYPIKNIIWIKDNITILGEGFATVLKAVSQFPESPHPSNKLNQGRPAIFKLWALYTDTYSTSKTKNVVIKDIAFDLNYIQNLEAIGADRGENILIQNVLAKNGYNYMVIHVDTSSGVTINNLYVIDSVGAVRCEETEGLIINNLYFYRSDNANTTIDDLFDIYTCKDVYATNVYAYRPGGISIYQNTSNTYFANIRLIKAQYGFEIKEWLPYGNGGENHTLVNIYIESNCTRWHGFTIMEAKNVLVDNLIVSCYGESPNNDAIHVFNSSNVKFGKVIVYANNVGKTVTFSLCNDCTIESLSIFNTTLWGLNIDSCNNFEVGYIYAKDTGDSAVSVWSSPDVGEPGGSNIIIRYINGDNNAWCFTTDGKVNNIEVLNYNCRNYRTNLFYIPDVNKVYVSRYVYSTLPTCNDFWYGKTITYYDGTNYNRCTCIDGSWKCVQLS